MGAAESNRLAEARRHGPFVAWRGRAGELCIEPLQPGTPLTVGRSTDNTVAFEHRLVSREHIEVRLRVLRQPPDSSVLLVDRRSKHGTRHRRVKIEHGAESAVGKMAVAPREPAAPLRLEPGDHDVQLAGEVWLRIGGVPVDQSATVDRDYDLPPPTKREHDVLVELCRPQFCAHGDVVVTPSNAQIGAALKRPIGAERVSDLLSQMYVKYGLRGTKEQNRLGLIELALTHRLVDAEDYG